MANHLDLQEFMDEWRDYLKERGHTIKLTRSVNVTRSVNGKGIKYRWLLLYSRTDRRRLTAIDHENIRREVRLAKRGHEQPYLVLRFETPVERVLVLPADKAAHFSVLRSDKAGIAWG